MHSTVQRYEHSEMEFGKKNPEKSSENRDFFPEQIWSIDRRYISLVDFSYDYVIIIESWGPRAGWLSISLVIAVFVTLECIATRWICLFFKDSIVLTFRSLPLFLSLFLLFFLRFSVYICWFLHPFHCDWPSWHRHLWRYMYVCMCVFVRVCVWERVYATCWF